MKTVQFQGGPLGGKERKFKRLPPIVPMHWRGHAPGFYALEGKTYEWKKIEELKEK